MKFTKKQETSFKKAFKEYKKEADEIAKNNPKKAPKTFEEILNEQTGDEPEKETLLDWLEKKKLSHYYDTFINHKIYEVKDIPTDMTVDELAAKLGINRSKRKSFSTAFQDLKKARDSQKLDIDILAQVREEAKQMKNDDDDDDDDNNNDDDEKEKVESPKNEEKPKENNVDANAAPKADDAQPEPVVNKEPVINKDNNDLPKED